MSAPGGCCGRWAIAFVATVAGIGLQGALMAGRGLSSVVDLHLVGPTLQTTFGRVWATKALLLVLAVPVLSILRRDGPAVVRSVGWRVGGSAVAVGLLRTPGLTSHASEERLTPGSDRWPIWSIWPAWPSGWAGWPCSASSCSPAARGEELGQAVARFSTLALASVVAITLAGGSAAEVANVVAFLLSRQRVVRHWRHGAGRRWGHGRQRPGVATTVRSRRLKRNAARSAAGGEPVQNRLKPRCGLSAAQRLRALDAPTVVVPRSALVAGATDAGLIRIPIPAFLIEHRDGIVLFDTGLAPEAAADPRGTYGDRADRLQLRFAENQRVDRQVLAAGYRPTEVTHVVLSHLHFDHAGGTHAFPAARVMVGAGELGHARSGADHYCRAVDVSRVAACDTRRAHLGHRPVRRRLRRRAGHARPYAWSSQPARAAAGSGLLLTGDAVHSRRAAPRRGAVPRLTTIRPRRSRSIRRIKSLADRSGADIWINHEPADWARLRPRHLP